MVTSRPSLLSAMSATSSATNSDRRKAPGAQSALRSFAFGQAADKGHGIAPALRVSACAVLNALDRLLGAEVAYRRRQRSIAEVDGRPLDDGSGPVDDEAKASALAEECQPIAPCILIQERPDRHEKPRAELTGAAGSHTSSTRRVRHYWLADIDPPPAFLRHNHAVSWTAGGTFST